MASTPLRRLFHWGPIAVLCIIKLITWAMVHLIGMWWPPTESVGGAVHAAVFLLFAASTLYYFLQSLMEGPGFVPLGWKPDKEEDKECLQFCSVCNGYKAPRSHHCRQCGRCVLKLDHHCPWINCCVGHLNHASFVKFLLAAVIGCLHASIVLSICIYHAIHRIWYIHNGTGSEPMIYLTLTTLLLTLLAIGMAIGVVLAVGTLFYFQIRSILKNQTTIEDWIMEKAVCRHMEQGLRPFVFPYDLGRKRNFEMVFSAGYDGIHWPVRDGCGEYDLTLEQLSQKRDKLSRSRLYRCVSRYSGRWLPLLQSPRAALAAPCSTEPRLPLREGDSVRVTRQRRYWLFGEKLTGSGEGRGPRGWFPRECAAPAERSRGNHAKPD
ncbi:palmitoyltransferase ZDHHC6 [Amyelois transitella]|uniref:palmitoyltransferase ZDHHC6 n=1 Tax=Amyelois transitella TaxID=680683 RepID=UPI00067C8362|nr:palmitoyltransferase ZDHHC6 [Amyelois transitella]